jgi:16S rRNA (cytosine967-C5)-methyltransferase
LKLFKPTSSAVVSALSEIFLQGKQADKVVENTLKSNPKFGSRDRKFIAESIYEIVRWWRLLHSLAAINQPQTEAEIWKVLGIYLLRSGIELPDWEEFNGVEYHPDWEATFERKVTESIPDWLDEIGQKELGERWATELHALNEKTDVVLRANTLKTSKKGLIKQLAKKEILVEELPGFEDALVLKQRQNLQATAEYTAGLFEIQDASSQLIVDFMQLEKGLSVVDACAGAGGKSLHIASRMHNVGSIISMDIEGRKLVELRKRAVRGGVSIIQTQTIESKETIKALANTADRLLLDVPCTGLGVLKRNPDAKWKLTPVFIDRIHHTQQSILQDYSVILKRNGIMVYATCSILPSENNEQVMRFLTTNPQFELLSERSVMPSEGFDGFYMAALRRIR